ncbi:hypothetical protein [Virgisporangium aurantiacum]|uniref:hypothetical protein n=1 Tax=Virgisporangium aurantiacum TaxID=175570 RepID=UPI0027E47A10|nr:hypothetical protein [Virgisporangium aurantiacum]
MQFEAMLIRNEMYANLKSGRKKFLPVILPDGSTSDIPTWLGGDASTNYQIKQLTARGVEGLLRYITDQPLYVAPPIGNVPVLPPRKTVGAAELSDSDDSAPPLATKLTAFSTDEMLLQSQVRQFLTRSDIGLRDDDLGLDLRDQEGRRHLIDIACANTVIQYKLTDSGRERGWRSNENWRLGSVIGPKLPDGRIRQY